MHIPSPLSPSFWTLIAGVCGVVLPNVGLAALLPATQAVLTAVGGLLLAIVSSHHVAANVSKATKPAPASPVLIQGQVTTPR